MFDLQASGDITDERVVRTLTLHLTAIANYERRDNGAKVLDHMASFELLLERYSDNEMISRYANYMLSIHAEALIAKWTE
ncbi:hypothetical protein [Geomicrobium sp. JCM 19037]|uniref:FIMAH domain-containing protein n=1 Tax=Geomicrobium sp. JCM 19037 TaxID=1460634 RepID=UPI0012697216|nr:hypothetical protein [Geomicrobium sp. JCM 19037]